jgi:hypothetical protein
MTNQQTKKKFYMMARLIIDEYHETKNGKNMRAALVNLSNMFDVDWNTCREWIIEVKENGNS